METSNLQFTERLSSLAETTVGVEAANADMAKQHAFHHEQQQRAAAAHETNLQELQTAHQVLKAEQAASLVQMQTELTAELPSEL